MSSRLLASIAASLCIGVAACGSRKDEAQAPQLAELQRTLSTLEARKTRIEDIEAIKRLQRAYGYYVDEGLWDEVVELFSSDGSIEIGLDGVYVGRDRIREYLYALGGGKAGLSEGQLNEHMQLMPVITVSPDGKTARGTWRALMMAGELGKHAVWGEGPYENEYVKEDGVWKIRKLHWFQTVIVPYEGGWVRHEDPTRGKHVSGTLPPDRPPSVEYGTWPDTFLPPFHFMETEQPGAIPTVTTTASADVQESLESLARRAARLAHEVQLLEDQQSIEALQRTYGFYFDKALWTHAADLFADDAVLEIAGLGAFVGRTRILEFLRQLGPEYPSEGRLYDHMQLQPIVHVAPDGRSAKGRWRFFDQAAIHGKFAEWGVGVLENEYVKDGGVWKIRRLHALPTMYTSYEDGWGKSARPLPTFMSSIKPDRPPSVSRSAYPAAFVAPFHYENPVTGAPVYDSDAVDLPALPSDPLELRSFLADLERRIGRLEDEAQIENLHAIYGYYLATNQWDRLTELFAEDGTIEIALRGVYVGKASVRRNLNLYGEQGIHHGLLHNHMQYQPVIHVADDGQTAMMRSRAFSMMGQFGRYAMWMGGVYENEFVKVDGVWKLKKDQVFNTYFVPYDVGWKNSPPRPAPGITESNPPDRPPTVYFEMYPKPFLPPFHYPNPVTGRPVTAPETARSYE